jgi:hypothetical protein
MRLLRSSSLPLLLALLLVPASTAGQALPTELRRLPLEAEIRLELAGGELLRGRLTRQDSVTLTLRRINRGRGHRAFLEHRMVALDSIVRSWSYDGNHWRVGAAVGAAVGAVAMAVFATGPASDEASCNAGCWLAAEGFGIAVGGGIGYLVGHGVPKWRELGAPR